MVMSALICMLAVGLQGGISVEDQVSSPLQTAGLTTSGARFDPGMLKLFRSAEFTTPLYDAASRDPWKAPFLFEVFTNDLQASTGKPNELLNIGTRYVGIGSRRTLIGDPIATPRTLSADLHNFEVEIVKLASGAKFDQSKLAQIPEEVRRATILLLASARQAREQYGLFLQSVFGTAKPGEEDVRSARGLVLEAMRDDATSSTFAAALHLFRKADLRHLVAGGHDLCLAAQEAAKIVAAVPQDNKYDFSIRTPSGWIRLSGGDNSSYGGGAGDGCLLVIDTGGNDRYENWPSATGADNWSSTVIDTSGDDMYVSGRPLLSQPVSTYIARRTLEAAPGPGGAFFGYSMLFDLRGKDFYRSTRSGIASGRLGVSILEDGEGDDTYDGYTDSVGFGMFGAGILEDISGNDTYAGFMQVQGVGQTAGFGALIDRGGSDTYLANDEDIDFPSAQSDKHNNSMSQGAGNGTRRDYLDAHSLAGGIGVLLDSGGDDRYSGAVFAQGVGYWEGVGILRDLSGRDSYSAGWYAQGASAHFAVGFLRDDAGDDLYNATMNMAQGAGHDFGAGYLLDLLGNDTYRAPNLSLGAGNANGIGLLLEMEGDDSYTSGGLTLGQSGEAPKGSLRMRALCLGVFADLGGKDTYPAQFSWAKNTASHVNWTARVRSPEESQLGIFWDGP